ncbi:MAG: hypothetical protein ACOCQR_03105 [bacterium]
MKYFERKRKEMEKQKKTIRKIESQAALTQQDKEDLRVYKESLRIDEKSITFVKDLQKEYGEKEISTLVDFICDNIGTWEFTQLEDLKAGYDYATLVNGECGYHPDTNKARKTMGKLLGYTPSLIEDLEGKIESERVEQIGPHGGAFKDEDDLLKYRSGINPKP